MLQNEFLRISVDAQTGAIVDITNRKSHLAYMARTSVAKPPFIVNAYSANQSIFIHDEFEKQSGGFSLYDPAAPAVKGDLSSLREPIPGSTEVTVETTSAFRRVWCRYLLPGGIAVRYSITLRPGSPLTDWRIFVENRGGETPARDQRVYRVAFPVLEGLRIGAAHENNFLARPFAQGELIPDPAAYEYKRPHGKLDAHQRTYVYRLGLDAVAGPVLEGGQRFVHGEPRSIVRATRPGNLAGPLFRHSYA